MSDWNTTTLESVGDLLVVLSAADWAEVDTEALVDATVALLAQAGYNDHYAEPPHFSNDTKLIWVR